MKKLLFVQQRAPHGTIYGQEGLDAILMGSAFAQCSLLLLEDAVFQLMSSQTPQTIGTKHYAVSYGALPDYGVENLYCSEKDLASRNLIKDDLLMDVTLVTDEQIQQIFAAHDVIMSFPG